MNGVMPVAPVSDHEHTTELHLGRNVKHLTAGLRTASSSGCAANVLCLTTASAEHPPGAFWGVKHQHLSSHEH